MNKVKLEGALVRKYVNDRGTFGEVSLKVENDEGYPATIKAKAFGELVSAVDALADGASVTVLGSLRNSKSTKDGNETWQLEVVAQSIEGKAAAADDIPF